MRELRRLGLARRRAISPGVCATFVACGPARKPIRNSPPDRHMLQPLATAPARAEY